MIYAQEIDPATNITRLSMLGDIEFEIFRQRTGLELTGEVTPESLAPIADVVVDLVMTHTTADARGQKNVFNGTVNGVNGTFESGSYITRDSAGLQHDICASTSAGCTERCTHCAVAKGREPFQRHLRPSEIALQVLHAIQTRNPDNAMPNTVGLMANGEPPANPGLPTAIEYLDILAQQGEIAMDRMIFSTIGERPRSIEALGDLAASMMTPLQMQLSLHAADDETRRVIVAPRPGIAGRTVDEIMETADEYTLRSGIPVKHNVNLVKGIGDYEGFTNTTPGHAEALAKIILSSASTQRRHTDIAANRIVKLSQFNPMPGVPFEPVSEEVMDEFAYVLEWCGVSRERITRFTGVGAGEDQMGCGEMRRSGEITTDVQAANVILTCKADATI